MGSVKVGKMRERYEESKRGGDFITFGEGDVKVYIHGTCRDDDEHELTEGVNYIPITVHYGLGKDRKFAVCLDPDANPILAHPFMRQFFKKKGTKLTGKCPVCAAIQSGDFSPDEANDARAQTKYIFGMTQIASRSKPSEEWKAIPPKPGVAVVGKTIYDGIVELYSDIGDVSEITAATLARVHREGKGKNDTKYKVVADSETTKKPLNIKKDKALFAALTKAMAVDGDCDLFRVAAGMVKSPAEVEALMSGVKMDTDDDDDDDLDEEVVDEADDEADLDKGDDDEEDDEDELPSPKKTKKKAVPVDEDEDESDDEDDEEEDPKPKPKAAAKKSKPPVDEDEGEDDADEDGDDEDDEDEEPVKAKAKPKSKPKAEEPEDDDEDEADDEDDEDEEEPEEKPKAKAKPAAKKAESSDDDELDELDAELDRLSKKKKAK